MLELLPQSVANLYDPDNVDPSFYHTFFSQIKKHTSNGITITRGDFNTALSLSMDRSLGSGISRISQSSTTIKEQIDDLGLW